MLSRSISAGPFVPSFEPPPPAEGTASSTAAGTRPESTAAVAPVHAVGRSGPSTFPGLAVCVEDARQAALVPSDGPPDPEAFAALRARLEKAKAALPPAQRRAVADPLLRTLDRLGAKGFDRLLQQDPERTGPARLLLDLAQAVLQAGEGYQPRATGALQEVVSDLYDGFLSEEDRHGVKPPDRGVVPPLVRWGDADAGPYTWPVTAAAEMGAGAGVVSLPAANASGGLLAWPALAHETAGHDLLAADSGLKDELARKVRERLLAGKMPPAVADYWADRIDETASDVLGVMNMGPAAAVGLVGYFRALNGAYSGTAALRNVGAEEDPHPADIARAYLAEETVRLLSFSGANGWADRLEKEADRDLGQIRLGDTPVTREVARTSAAIVARTIVKERLRALENHALGEIQDWGDDDEKIVGELRAAMRSGDAASVARSRGKGAYAAHAVAAAVYEAVERRGDPRVLQERMVAVLAEMHGKASTAGSPGALVVDGAPA